MDMDQCLGHMFDGWARDLMSTPPVIDKWQVEQLKADIVDGPYRDEYRKLPIVDNGEPLVACSNYGIVSKDYYFNKLADGEMVFFPALEKKLFYPVAWLRKTVAESLQKADRLLRGHGLFLVVNSGWRHPQVQELAIEWSKKFHGEKETTRRYANVDPNRPKSVVPHQTGGACDLELWSLLLNKSLTRMKKNDEIRFYELEMKNNLTNDETERRFVRRILFHVLTTPKVCLDEKHVFLIHPGEFWHFGFGDPLTAYFRHEPCAIYGSIEPPRDYNMYSF